MVQGIASPKNVGMISTRLPNVQRKLQGDLWRSKTLDRADQMLAWFAQPGKLMCPKETDPRRDEE